MKKIIIRNIIVLMVYLIASRIFGFEPVIITLIASIFIELIEINEKLPNKK